MALEQRIDEVMTPYPKSVDADACVIDAATIMRDADVGDVIVLSGGNLFGIITDRDIAVRVVAEGLDPTTTKVSQACSSNVAVVSPDENVADAYRLMSEHAVRRLPVVVDSQPIGIVSLGDLVVGSDPESTLSKISAAPPDE